MSKMQDVLSGLMTKAQKLALQKNWGSKGVLDLRPVVKLFTPDGAATWLLVALDSDGDAALGLCDLGFGSPEVGLVSLGELAAVRGKLGLPVERDLYFRANRSLREYAEQARNTGGLSV